MTDTKNENRKDKKKPLYLDYNIFQGKVKLVQENGKTVVIERDSAIDMAKSQGKNLMQVGYNKSEFPHSICKIVDYGKFLYDQKKKEKERAKKAREANAEAKEIYFSIRICVFTIKIIISFNNTSYIKWCFYIKFFYA